MEYTDAIHGIRPESDNILVRYVESELDDSFQGRVAPLLILYFSWTPTNEMLRIQELLSAGNTLSSVSKRCKKTQRWILHLQAQENAEAIPTMFKDLHGWADCIDGFIRVVK